MSPAFDLIIIGAGPAGLTAAFYAGRYGLKVAILEKMVAGGRILLTESIENFPGFVGGVLAQDLMQRMQEQVNELGIEVVLEEALFVDCKRKTVKTTAITYTARALIVAVGARPKKLNIPGEEKLTGRGASYCATCDGPLFKNKKVVVVGGGDTVAEEALYLSRLTDSVTIIHRRDQMRASAVLQARLKENKRINFMLSSIVTRIEGTQKVEAIAVKDVLTNKEQVVSCDGIFICIGYEPETALFKDQLRLDESGFIITDEKMGTQEAGVFACGDCRKKTLYQVVTACADGALAAHSAFNYISSNKG